MDETEKQSMLLKDMFPKLDPERVGQLVELEDFQAKAALLGLRRELGRRKKDGDDVEALSQLLDKVYKPSMNALDASLKKAGWNMSEISAAHMVEDGSVRLK